MLSGIIIFAWMLILFLSMNRMYWFRDFHLLAMHSSWLGLFKVSSFLPWRFYVPSPKGMASPSMVKEKWVCSVFYWTKLPWDCLSFFLCYHSLICVVTGVSLTGFSHHSTACFMPDLVCASCLNSWWFSFFIYRRSCWYPLEGVGENVKWNNCETTKCFVPGKLSININFHQSILKCHGHMAPIV